MVKTRWNAEDVAAALSVNCEGDWQATGVSIDSRTVAPGDLFVALKGERFDGHDYAKDAIESGAVAVIVSQPAEGVDAQQCIMVDDTEVALQQLGVYARSRSDATFLGITGSVGKTGCKEMLSCALSALGDVYATKGNLNNHLGVPLTLANMPEKVDYAVIEMGMNHAGEISQLSQWVKPDVAVITTVDAVHIEFFDSVEGIADAKSEIFDGMSDKGVAFINADNPHYDRVNANAKTKGLCDIRSFGSTEEAQCQMKQYHFDERGEGLISEVHAVVGETRLSYSLAAVGKHWGLMSVAVLGMVDAVNGDVAKAAVALSNFQEPDGRGKIAKLKVKGGSLKLIDDSYNASPVAMEAAFEKLYMLKMQEKGSRTVAVLGDMLELGDKAQEMHLALVPALINNQIDLVFAAGQMMKHMYDELPDSMRGDYNETAAGLAPKAVAKLQDRDIVLVKGSNGSRMRDVVEAIDRNAALVEDYETEA